MKYDKEKLKEEAVKLYLDGKKYLEISKILGCSRNYVSTLIRADNRVIDYQNKKIVKLYKHLYNSKITIPISLDYWEKIGISKNPNVSENVQIEVDEKAKKIIIEKYNI